MPKLEIAATTLQDAQRAQQGGADSIEISQDLTVGGLTPPLDLVQQIRAAVTLHVHVIVRPHARDFVYTAAEIDQILADTHALAQIGIDGIVFGALTKSGTFDTALTTTVKNAAHPVPITIHRALDECINPEEALTELMGVVPRVLTSGPAANAWDGRGGLQQWVQRFGESFQFVASGGLRMDHLPTYVHIVNAHEYHFGSAARANHAVDVEKVRQLGEIIKRVET